MTDEKEEKARKTFKGITDVLDDLAKGAGEEAAKSTDFPTEKVEEVLKGMARAIEKEQSAEKPKEEENTPLVSITDMLMNILGTKTNIATPEQETKRKAFLEDIKETIRVKYNELDSENQPAIGIVMKFKDDHLYKASNMCDRHATLLLLEAAVKLVTDTWPDEKEEESEQESKPET